MYLAITQLFDVTSNNHYFCHPMQSPLTDNNISSLGNIQKLKVSVVRVGIIRV